MVATLKSNATFKSRICLSGDTMTSARQQFAKAPTVRKGYLIFLFRFREYFIEDLAAI